MTLAESPHLVYNELVSLRLAQSLKVPVADGVLTVSGDGLAYASLEVALPGKALPDALPSQFGVIAQDCPHESAGLLAFAVEPALGLVGGVCLLGAVPHCLQPTA